MNKAKLLNKYKDLYGGKYFKQNGKVYWKETETSEPLLVVSGWVLKKVQEALNGKPVKTKITTPVVGEKKEEDFSPLPQIKKTTPKKKKITEETPKTE